MRIAIDAHALGTRAGGNETFVRQLLLGLREVAPEADIVALIQRTTGLPYEATSGFPVHRLACDSSWLRVPYALPRAVRETQADLLHVQYIAPPRCACPFVVTLHDLVWLRYPDTLRAIDRTRLEWLVPGTLRRAARVFTVSDAMKREASELCDVPPEKIDVVHNSLDPRFAPVTDPDRLARTRRRYNIPGPYVLYAGSLHPRKNVVRLAQALEEIRRKHGLLHTLVLAGKPLWFHKRVLEDIGLTNANGHVIVTGYVDDADLPALMSGADAFAYISLYEGFGVPVLEAMACGTPVLGSTDPAISEVAADAALLCDPTDLDAIVDGLFAVLTDEALRARLRAAGPLRAQSFTPAGMARAAWTGYQRALQGEG